MTNHARNFINSDVTGPLQWWEWCAVLAAIAFYALFMALSFNIDVPPLVMAVIVHFFLDFTIQTSDTSSRKATGDFRTILYHSFITGGFPGLILGGMPGLILGFLWHMAIDITPKFWLPHPYGAIADQLAHVATAIMIFWVIA